MVIMKEEEYLKQRQQQADILSYKFLQAYDRYPIHQNKIVFSSFEGDGGFGCNPRYIAEELHKIDGSLKMIWLLHDTKKEFPAYIEPVKDSVENIVYHLATAKVWIDNYRKPYGTLKREGQLYIQTWHGSMGIKAVGLYRGSLFPKIARMVSEWDSSLCDYVLSDSDYNDNIYPKKLLYNGPTLRTGFPRIDCLINDKNKLRIKLHQKYGIKNEIRCLLFAPTFRGGNQTGNKKVISEIPTINFDSLLQGLEKKYNCKWRILLRLHPQLSAKMSNMKCMQENSMSIDVSQEPDVSQILGGCDLVITDYSSIAFDAGYAGIPVLLYADDFDDYVQNRGKIMWTRDELPFIMSETNEELMEAIEKFNYEEFMNNMRKFMKYHGVVEDGKAGQRVAKFILKFIN